jgi:hypothetical protein
MKNIFEEKIFQFEKEIRDKSDKVFDFMNDIDLDSMGEHHRLLHEIIEQRIDQLNPQKTDDRKVLCVFTYCINMSTTDGFRLVLKINEKLMSLIKWDGITLFFHSSDIKRSENKDIFKCLLDIHFRVPVEVTREVIEILQDDLESTHMRKIQIAFLFLHSWIAGGLPSTVNLDNFMPVLDKYITEEDSYKKTYSLIIKEFINIHQKKNKESCVCPLTLK